jgi:molybdopterin converting factor small subunit
LDEAGWLEMQEGSRVRDILRGASLIAGTILPVFVNNQQAKKSHPLKDGDTVMFLYPLRGG